MFLFALCASLRFVSMVLGSPDASCLLSCAPVSLQNSSAVSAACDSLLSGVYRGCTSFSLVTGRCRRDAVCRSQCSAAEWCYFGLGMLQNCPSDRWDALKPAVQDLVGRCVVAEEYLAFNGGVQTLLLEEVPDDRPIRISNATSSHINWIQRVTDNSAQTMLLVGLACKL